MAKNTMGTKLPRKLEQKMSIAGEQIKLARLRRNLSVAQVAERATCSPLTVSRIEKGVPTVAIGIYLRVLYALQLDYDILWLAKEDNWEKLARFEFEDKETSFKKGIDAYVLPYSKIAFCAVGIKNMVLNFVLCCKNIMFVLHNK